MTKPEGSAEAEKEEDSREEPIPIEICRGYSRDRRLDLKQFLLTLVCTAVVKGSPSWLTDKSCTPSPPTPLPGGEG